tara:strand:- start:1481 stop:2065 length:585 start_codon:yes stop_codon:yes gene_type:complete
MPTVANTPIKVCSRASVLIGGDEIQSFTDGTAESLVVDAIYEDVARAALTNTRWRFAANQAVLNRLSSAPTGRWDAAYQLPSDSLLIHVITINDEPINYDTYGDKAFCDAVSTDVLVADYSHRADEADWPSYFTIAVEHMLAGALAISVARDASLSQMMEQKAQFYFSQARRLESQQQTTRKLNTSRFIAQRRS